MSNAISFVETEERMELFAAHVLNKRHGGRPLHVPRWASSSKSKGSKIENRHFGGSTVTRPLTSFCVAGPL